MKKTYNNPYPLTCPLRLNIANAYRMDETTCIEHLLTDAVIPSSAQQAIATQATKLIVAVRNKKSSDLGIEQFLQHYKLNSQEGIALLCLAEALLRVPDRKTINDLIFDKIRELNQPDQKVKSTFFMNASTWALMLTGKVTGWRDLKADSLSNALKRLVEFSGKPVIRRAIAHGMKILGQQFVMGASIDKAISRAKAQETKGYRYSYDMLGEAARTEADALRYFKAYQDAIDAIGRHANGDPVTNAGISIKLSALHPRYELVQYEQSFSVLLSRVEALALQAKKYNIGLTIDAEEANRLDFSLDIIKAVFSNSALSDWEGLGLALQAYQKRAWYVIDWLADLAKQYNRRIMIRLIKGAYWDSEIKDSQVNGYEGYPVFTRKMSTDVSYIACAKKILGYGRLFYPQFATHNAHSIATILHFAGDRKDFEFQCLHGMGQTLYDEIVTKQKDTSKRTYPCRVYAPVGVYEDLLPYLVRRLLENGANTSFINHIADSTIDINTLIKDPIKQVMALHQKPHPSIALPKAIYGDARENAMGVDLSDPIVLKSLFDELTALSLSDTITATALIDAEQSVEDVPLNVLYKPFNTTDPIGQCTQASDQQVATALDIANKVANDWARTSTKQRADCLLKMADLLQDKQTALIHLLIQEAGKTFLDAMGEVREAIDFCRFYAKEALRLCGQPMVLTGPTGEHNELSLHGRGVIVCISPWNFPLAIFMGQIAAALVTGNAVLAKPAEQTPLVAYVATQLFYEAGIPRAVLQLLPGTGERVGAQLVADVRVSGVMFTGSTQTARHINQVLANRDGAIVPLIAETGGQNAMIVDSTALPEQVVQDVVQSAFGSAGQRCSALRVLYLQKEIADKVIAMLKGAMATLQVGDPSCLSTDVGPVIDQDALAILQDHYNTLSQSESATFLYQTPLVGDKTRRGHFFAPCVFEIDNLSVLTREVFGPCLHVIRYDIAKLDHVLESIHETGYGLTLGVHSRIEERIQYICQRAHVGNMYVNRNMVGAVVGVQPFGGEGLSGTGPKAGGPHYLLRLCNERTLSVDVTASGGNASLMMLDDALDPKS